MKTLVLNGSCPECNRQVTAQLKPDGAGYLVSVVPSTEADPFFTDSEPCPVCCLGPVGCGGSFGDRAVAA